VAGVAILVWKKVRRNGPRPGPIGPGPGGPSGGGAIDGFGAFDDVPAAGGTTPAAADYAPTGGGRPAGGRGRGGGGPGDARAAPPPPPVPAPAAEAGGGSSGIGQADSSALPEGYDDTLSSF